MGWFGIGEAIIGTIDSVLDKAIPDAAERERIKLQIRQADINADIKKMETAMSAILAEAKSSDPWTSRARPSFLYVMYALILFAIPMGFLHAFQPDLAFNIADGFNNWLLSIPTDFVTLFGIGYLGYAGSRSIEKIKGVQK